MIRRSVVDVAFLHGFHSCVTNQQGSHRSHAPGRKNEKGIGIGNKRRGRKQCMQCGEGGEGAEAIKELGESYLGMSRHGEEKVREMMERWGEPKPELKL